VCVECVGVCRCVLVRVGVHGARVKMKGKSRSLCSAPAGPSPGDLAFISSDLTHTHTHTHTAVPRSFISADVSSGMRSKKLQSGRQMCVCA